jgi:hypothetical protein
MTTTRRTRPGATDTPPKPRAGADGLAEDLRATRHELLSSRHPTYHKLLGVVLSLLEGEGDAASDLALQARFDRSWRTRSFPTFYERPLLILAALRADALLEGPHHPLHGAIAADAPDAEVITPETVAAALARDRLGVWSTMTTRRVQTNDTSRAVAWLWPAFLAGCDGGAAPMILADIGASAGLNLIADRLPSVWKDRAAGQDLPCVTRPNVIARVGFDPRALDVGNRDDVVWMRACIWPGETARLARFEASVVAMRAVMGKPGAPAMERTTASLAPEQLEKMAASAPPDTILLTYHTLLTGYLEPTEADRYRDAMLALIARRPVGRGLWLELELDDGRRRLPALLVANVRVGGAVKALRLGRMSQHPSEVEVDAAAVAELKRVFGT